MTLTKRDITHYRAVLVNHRNQGPSHRCEICRRPRCRDWVRAYDTLAQAGQLMAGEMDWLDAEARADT